MTGASYAYLMPQGTKVARTIEVDDGAMVDVTSDDRVIGVETLDERLWTNVLVTLVSQGRLRARSGGTP